MDGNKELTQKDSVVFSYIKDPLSSTGRPTYIPIMTNVRYPLEPAKPDSTGVAASRLKQESESKLKP